MQRQQKITLGEMRSDNGPRRLIVYAQTIATLRLSSWMPNAGAMTFAVGPGTEILLPSLRASGCRRQAAVRAGAYGNGRRLSEFGVSASSEARRIGMTAPVSPSGSWGRFLLKNGRAN
jgi:hypothetical protein